MTPTVEGGTPSTMAAGGKLGSKVRETVSTKVRNTQLN